MDNYFSHIEWEQLQNSIASKFVDDAGNIQPTPDQIEVKRGADFKIEVLMSREGVTYQEAEFERKERLGEVLIGTDVHFIGAYDQRVTLHKVIQYGNSIKGRTDGKHDVRTQVSCHKVSSIYQGGATPMHTLQYLIGCPTTYMWARGTKRDKNGSTTISRERIGSGGIESSKSYDFSASIWGVSSSTDCILLKNSHGEVLFGHPPPQNEATKQYLPCYLHFSEEEKSIEQDFRDSWVEAISFAIGKRLFPVGHSIFDRDGIPIEEHSYTPYTANFKREVFSPELPPCYSGEDEYTIYSEEKLSHLIGLYLAKRSALNLKDVLSNFWAANAMPLGLNFICYSAALEMLIDGWFNSQNEDKITKYVSGSDYAKIVIGPSIAEIEKIAPNDKNWTAVRNRLHIPNDLSLAEKKRRFFLSLNMQIGKVEEEALKARNKYAHGASTSDTDPAELLMLTRAFQTLINRCILKCIGYDGEYFDYSALDFPMRKLDDPLQGRS